MQSIFVRKNERLIIIKTLLLCALLVLSSACSQNEDQEPPSGLFVHLSYGDCKEFGEDTATTAARQDCLGISVFGNELRLKHLNAAFNCCPGQINADVVIEDSTIIITESETEAGCHCLCLYDLSYTIVGLKPGTYTVRVIEPYRKETDQLLECRFEMIDNSSVECCVDRHTYPWE